MANIKCANCKYFYCELGEVGQPMIVLGCQLGHWASTGEHKMSDFDNCIDYEREK